MKQIYDKVSDSGNRILNLDTCYFAFQLQLHYR